MSWSVFFFAVLVCGGWLFCCCLLWCRFSCARGSEQEVCQGEERMKGEATGGGVCVGFSFSQHRQESGVGEAGTRQVRETCSLPRWECVGWFGCLGSCSFFSSCWFWSFCLGVCLLSHCNLLC